MKNRVAIIGAGELGLQIIELLLESDKYEMFGFYDDSLPKNTNVVYDFKVLGNTNEILIDYHQDLFDYLIVAIGYNHMQKRSELFELFSKEISFATLIHSSCVVNRSASIEQGAIIYPGCILDKNVHIGQNVLLNLGVIISHDSVIEDHCFIAPGVKIAGFSSIEKACFVGIGAIVIDNIKINKNLIIGAGAVVVNDLIELGKYGGNPAKKLK